METFYQMKEEKKCYKKNVFLEDHGGDEDIPMLGVGLVLITMQSNKAMYLLQLFHESLLSQC